MTYVSVYGTINKMGKGGAFMREFQWSEAYGTLTEPTETDRIASNLTSLWQTPQMRDLLALWSMTDGKNESLTSDYERFRALCRMMPYLDGHPVKRYCETLLQTCFSCTLPPDAAHCDAIWQETAHELLMHPRTVGDLLSKSGSKRYLLWTDDALPKALPNGLVPELMAERLYATSAISLGAWEEELAALADCFARYGSNRIFFEFPNSFEFVSPDPYHVNLALAKEHQTAADHNLLTSQLFRMICALCIARGWGVHLQVGDCAEAAVALLTYAEKSVGLPELYWSTVSSVTRDTLLAFGYATHQNAVLPLLRLCDYPSDVELQTALSAYAARYPIGMLHVSYGADLRMELAEQARLQSILENGKE